MDKSWVAGKVWVVGVAGKVGKFWAVEAGDKAPAPVPARGMVDKAPEVGKASEAVACRFFEALEAEACMVCTLSWA